MALDEIKNRVEEVDGVQRVYCANHADPRCGGGDDELGSIGDEIDRLSWAAQDVEVSTEAAVALDARHRVALPRAIRQARKDKLEA